jgi:PAS domain S-box-containing protein
MGDEDKTKVRLIHELSLLRQRVVELEMDKNEQKVLQDALRRSKEKYRSIFQNAPVGIYHSTVGGKFIDLNPEIAKMLGYASPDEVLTVVNETSIAEALYVDPELRSKIIDKAVDGKSEWVETETMFRRKDGETIIARLLFRKIPGELSEPYLLEGFAEDITGSKRTEEALRASETTYRIVADNTYDWEYWEGPAGQFLYSSPSCQRITGYAATEFEADPGLLCRIVHPDDRPKLADHLQPRKTGGKPCEMEFRIIHRQGTTRWIGHVCQPVFDAQGRFLGHRGSNRDITDRKRGEEALKKAHDELDFRVKERTTQLKLANDELQQEIMERRHTQEALESAYRQLQDIIDFLPDATFVIDKDKRVIAWNLAMEDMTGVKKDDILGRSEYAYAIPFYGEARPILIDLAMGDEMDLEKRYDLIERREKKVYGETFVPMAHKGKAAHVWAIASPLFDSRGNLVGAVESVRDITSMKREEDQILKLHSLEEQLLGPGELNEKLKYITDGTVEIFGADLARIWITREGDLCDHGCIHANVTDGQDVCRQHTLCLHLIASSGHHDNPDGRHLLRVPIGCHKIGRIASGEDSNLIANVITQDPLVHDLEWAMRRGLTSFVGYRLLSTEGKPIGVLGLSRELAIEPEEVRLLQDLANTTSQVIAAAMATEALRESETRYRQLFCTVPDAVFIFDSDTRQFIDMNESALRMYGYARHEFLKLKHADITGEPELSDASIRESLASGKLVRIPLRYHRKKDGTIFPVEISGGTFFIAGRRVLFAAVRDITKRKHAEQELNQYRNHLEDLVADRTAELAATNEQLRREIEERRRAEAALLQSEETLQESESNLRSLTAQLFTIQETERKRISKELHDGLGQELTVLKISLSSIQDRLRKDQQFIKGECDFLLSCIDNIIEDTRRLCHDLSPYLLEELGLLPSLKHLFAEVCQRNNLVCSFDMEPIDYPLPRETLVAIYRIFQEALTNIVKHSKATRVTLFVKKKPGKLLFTVTDNGDGFDIGSVNQRPPSKRGMGLFAMSERAHILGGSFQIVSQKGEGAMISFSLPIKGKGK